MLKIYKLAFLPCRPVVIVNDVFVSVRRIERIIFLRAKPEQSVSVVDVDPQRIDGGDHRVDADVEFVTVDCGERKSDESAVFNLRRCR